MLGAAACDPQAPAAAPEATAQGSGASSASSAPIAKVWKRRCGQCHGRVEPGTRSRPVIEAALLRHRKRVRLKEEQWAELADFLAPEPVQAAPPPPVPGPSPLSAPLPPEPAPSEVQPDAGE
jgi:hypothetical protein